MKAVFVFGALLPLLSCSPQTDYSGELHSLTIRAVYPDGFEKYHFKAAIPARNKFMVDNANYAICYVNHGWGGAAKTYERAKKKGLNIRRKDRTKSRRKRSSIL